MTIRFIMLMLFFAQGSFSLENLENKADAVGSAIELAVEKYIQEKESLNNLELPFLLKPHDNVIDLYSDLADVVRNQALIDRDFLSRPVPGFKRIFMALCRWYTQGRVSENKTAHYLATLRKQEAFPGEFSNDEAKVILHNKLLNLMDYLQTVEGLTYPELLAFSHFLASTKMSDKSSFTWRRPGVPYFQAKLDAQYVLLPVDEFCAISFDSGNLSPFVPAQMAKFSTVTAVLPYPFSLSKEELLKAYKSRLSPMGISIMPLIADDSLMYSGEYALHDMFHCIVFLLTYYGFVFKADSPGTISSERFLSLISYSEARYFFDKELIDAIEKRTFRSEEFFTEEMAYRDKLKRISESHSFDNQFLPMDKIIFSEITKVILFFYAHEYFHEDENNLITPSLLFLNGAEENYYRITKEMLKGIFDLLDPSFASFNTEYVWNLYMQTAMLHALFAQQEEQKDNFISLSESLREHWDRVKNWDDVKVSYSPTYILFGDDNISMEFKDYLERMYHPWYGVFILSPRVAINKRPIDYFITVPQIGGQGVYLAPFGHSYSNWNDW